MDLSTRMNFKRFLWLSNSLEKDLREQKAARDKEIEKMKRLTG